MKVLFIGVGLTDYINQVLNKLQHEPNIAVVNLVDADGVGHVPAGAHQSRKGIEFEVVELPGFMARKYSDEPYRNFAGLPGLLRTVRPDCVVVSEKFVGMFFYDKALSCAMHELGIKIIMHDNPFRLQRYEVIREAILAGDRDEEYTPFYVQYAAQALARLRLGSAEKARVALMKFLRLIRLVTVADSRRACLRRLEEKKRMFNTVDALSSYIEEAYDLYGSYGVPREKIFITYNSPDTDMLFEVRKKIEKEPSIFPHNPHRLIHVGRLIPWKRVDMLMESVAALKDEFPDAELLIIGYGPQEAELRALVHRLGLEDAVTFVGGVYEPSVLGKYLMASSIYVLAGMGGISINDAMVFGRPIICSVCDGTEKKLVYDGRNGFYFKDGVGEDLTAKIRQAWRDPLLLERMGEQSTSIIANEINIHTVLRGYKNAFAYVLRKAV